MRRRRAAAALAAVLALAACSGDDEAAPTTTASPFGPAECAPGAPVLLVDQIDDAIAAVEAELGGPQEYFEINATSLLVNLFVADVATQTVTPYAYVGGELTSEDPLDGAQGYTFVADQVQVDDQRVLSCVVPALPDSTVDVFFVEGADGGVRYTVLTSNDKGGQLTVEVSGEGQVIGVDAV